MFVLVIIAPNEETPLDIPLGGIYICYRKKSMQLSENSNRPCCPMQRGGLVSKFCQVIPSALEALHRVLEEVMQVVKELPCAPEEVDGIQLALNEALANAIVHGNKSDPSKNVIVACFCDCETNGGLLIVVQDEGPGFDPRKVPDPTKAERIYSSHGRGIYLVRHLMDDVTYRNGGREVDLRKRKR